jgi:hypothetical protein
MHLENLKLVITETDLNEFALKFLPPHAKVRNLSVRVTTRGVTVAGTYDAGLSIPFETLWEVLLCEGHLAARLAALKTGFLSLGFGQSYLVSAIAAAARLIGRRGDLLLLDVDAILAERGVPLRTNLSEIHCEQGKLVIEARAAV